MTSVLAMPLALSILLVSQQDIDHVYSAIVPIIQSLYYMAVSKISIPPQIIGLLLQVWDFPKNPQPYTVPPLMRKPKPCKVQNLQSKNRWVLKRLKPQQELGVETA